jgi:hypothetical protein
MAYKLVMVCLLIATPHSTLEESSNIFKLPLIVSMPENKNESIRSDGGFMIHALTVHAERLGIRFTKKDGLPFTYEWRRNYRPHYDGVSVYLKVTIGQFTGTSIVYPHDLKSMEGERGNDIQMDYFAAEHALSSIWEQYNKCNQHGRK